MTFLDSLDPGRATGWATGWYDDDTPYELDEVGIYDFKKTARMIRYHREWWVEAHFDNRLVVEGFRLQGGLPYTPDLTGVEIIGGIRTLEIPFKMQFREDKALVPDEVLKEHGLWQTGKTVGHTDGRDANDAIIHALVFLMRIGHKPTIEKYFRSE